MRLALTDGPWGKGTVRVDLRSVSPGSPRELCERFHNASSGILLRMAFPQKKYVWWALVAGISAVPILFATTAFVLRPSALRPRLVAALSDALNCDVALDRIDVHLLPTTRVTGGGLTVRLRNRPDLPPFIAVEQFSVGFGLLSVLRRHVDTVELDGLALNVPKNLDSVTGPAASADDSGPRKGWRGFSINHVVAHDAMLHFVGQTVDHRPLLFPISVIDLRDAAIDRPMQFTATVSNPLPEGLVTTTGTFGPWNRDDPTDTPVAGSYEMPVADLGTINGVGGHAASTGTFSGQLTEILVAGSTRTTDFSLDLGGAPVTLTTTFDAAVDGTTGTIRFDRIDATLLQTSMRLTGRIINVAGPGHDLAFKAEIKDGRVEDIVRLAIDSPRPILTGDVSLSATVRVPHGTGRARDRLQVAGTFGLGAAHFTDADVQAKLKELSRRGQGRDKDEEMASRIATSFGGTFELKGGVLSMPRLSFTVPGATLLLSGHYTIGSEEVAFTGTARLKASLSDAIGGFKSIFIKPFNGLFSKDGSGAIIPIEITGTRSNPEFHVRKGAIFKKGKELYR